jgi:hypothetical protein
MIGKVLAEQCFQKNLKGAYDILAEVDKAFIAEHGKEKVEESMRSFQKDLSVIVMSKIPESKFMGSPGAIGNKAIVDKMKELQSKLEIPNSSPIPLVSPKFPMSGYVKQMSHNKGIDDMLMALM